jgi:hypothetical protein
VLIRVFIDTILSMRRPGEVWDLGRIATRIRRLSSGAASLLQYPISSLAAHTARRQTPMPKRYD